MRSHWAEGWARSREGWSRTSLLCFVLRHGSWDTHLKMSILLIPGPGCLGGAETWSGARGKRVKVSPSQKAMGEASQRVLLFALF